MCRSSMQYRIIMGELYTNSKKMLNIEMESLMINDTPVFLFNLFENY